MTYEEAETLGRELGLTEPAEFVNNVQLHCLNLFAYSELNKELTELYKTAKDAGVRFSDLCEHAVLSTDSTEEVCYICRKLQ